MCRNATRIMQQILPVAFSLGDTRRVWPPFRPCTSSCRYFGQPDSWPNVVLARSHKSNGTTGSTHAIFCPFCETWSPTVRFLTKLVTKPAVSVALSKLDWSMRSAGVIHVGKASPFFPRDFEQIGLSESAFFPPRISEPTKFFAF